MDTDFAVNAGPVLTFRTEDTGKKRGTMSQVTQAKQQKKVSLHAPEPAPPAAAAAAATPAGHAPEEKASGACEKGEVYGITIPLSEKVVVQLENMATKGSDSLSPCRVFDFQSAEAALSPGFEARLNAAVSALAQKLHHPTRVRVAPRSIIIARSSWGASEPVKIAHDTRPTFFCLVHIPIEDAQESLTDAFSVDGGAVLEMVHSSCKQQGKLPITMAFSSIEHVAMPCQVKPRASLILAVEAEERVCPLLWSAKPVISRIACGVREIRRRGARKIIFRCANPYHTPVGASPEPACLGGLDRVMFEVLRQEASRCDVTELFQHERGLVHRLVFEVFSNSSAFASTMRRHVQQLHPWFRADERASFDIQQAQLPRLAASDAMQDEGGELEAEEDEGEQEDEDEKNEEDGEEEEEDNEAGKEEDEDPKKNRMDQRDDKASCARSHRVRAPRARRDGSTARRGAPKPTGDGPSRPWQYSAISKRLPRYSTQQMLACIKDEYLFGDAVLIGSDWARRLAFEPAGEVLISNLPFADFVASAVGIIAFFDNPVSTGAHPC
jgi:hypothetical protein